MIRRRLFAVFSAVSLLVAVAAGAMWVRSYFTADSFYKATLAVRPQEFRQWTVRADGDRGHFQVQIEYWRCRQGWTPPIPAWFPTESVREQAAIRRRAYLQQMQATWAYRRLLSEASRTPAAGWYSTRAAATRPPPPTWKSNWSSMNTETNRGWTLELAAPHWAIAAAACALAGACWWLRGRIRPKFPANCCRRCGYDMRATPQGCPECGTTAPPQLEVAA